MVRLLVGVPAIASTRRSIGRVFQAFVLLTIAALALPGCGQARCERQADCPQDEYCKDEPLNVFSPAGTCEDRGGKGDSCEPYVNVPGPEGKRRLEGSCRPGLFCRNHGQEENVCVPPQGRGGTCEISYHCNDGLTCELGDVPGKHTCRPLSNEGESCRASRDCHAGLACGKSGACQPWRQEGDPCAAYYECVPGMDCVDGICERR